MSRLLGLRNITCTKDDWYYLVFYDIDKPIDNYQVEYIDIVCRKYYLSYILYKTKHGYHFVGFTPVDAITWAKVFTELKEKLNSYYSGNVIRLSRKKDEIQSIVNINTEYGKVIPNLYNIYAQRFNLSKRPWTIEQAEYQLVFEKYKSLND